RTGVANQLPLRQWGPNLCSRTKHTHDPIFYPVAQTFHHPAHVAPRARRNPSLMTTNHHPGGELATYVNPESPQQMAIWQALAKVIDPEIPQHVSALAIVASVVLNQADLSVTIRLTISGCPTQDAIHTDVDGALKGLADVSVRVQL